ncbi:basic proline-rich protein-like [Dromiciops gliroides]|uniref:basic proline-rich protein-like n=1 Tax=Dromiciops gliroides TaxID=33562 RepID=UPI001CC79C8B|nr:basic proline-rich protein-like [Dromiciops gliroides]
MLTAGLLMGSTPGKTTPPHPGPGVHPPSHLGKTVLPGFGGRGEGRAVWQPPYPQVSGGWKGANQKLLGQGSEARGEQAPRRLQTPGDTEPGTSPRQGRLETRGLDGALPSGLQNEDSIRKDPRGGDTTTTGTPACPPPPPPRGWALPPLPTAPTPDLAPPARRLPWGVPPALDLQPRPRGPARTGKGRKEAPSRPPALTATRRPPNLLWARGVRLRGGGGGREPAEAFRDQRPPLPERSVSYRLSASERASGASSRWALGWASTPPSPRPARPSVSGPPGFPGLWS